MINAVIGARGDMGKNLLLPWLKKLGPVVAVDKDSSKKQWQKVWAADVIWLAVPRDVVPTALRGVRLRPQQLVIDICSIKRGVARIIKRTGGSHLSLHPLQGPHVPLHKQKWVVIGNRRGAHAQQVLRFLKKGRVHFLSAATEVEHDRMMDIVLGLPECISILIEMVMQATSGVTGRKVSWATLLDWSVPASQALFLSNIHSITSSPVWLRRELVGRTNDRPLHLTRKAMRKFVTASDAHLAKIISHQPAGVRSSLSTHQQKQVSSMVNQLFAASRI